MIVSMGQALVRHRKRKKDQLVVCKGKLFGLVLRGTMTKMPLDAVELLPYVYSIERLF